MRRALARLAYHSARMTLRLVDVFSARAHMAIFLPLLRILGVRLSGLPRYISPASKFDDFQMIELGDRVVVSSGVIFLTHDYALTTLLIAAGCPPETDKAFLREIVIGNNVFIGMNALVLPGTVIEDNVIVGAGSVVRGRVPADSIVAGNPATRIGALTDKKESWTSHMASSQMRIDAR